MTELVRSWGDARTEALYAGHAHQCRVDADLFAALLVGTVDTVVALVEDGESAASRRSPQCSFTVAWLPEWFNRLFASARLVAHAKKLSEGGALDVRPMAVREAERRAAERAAVVDNMKEAYVSVLSPSQLGLGISAGD
eukprot:jgi/Tetstr1/460626/TSEL_005824.t1